MKRTIYTVSRAWLVSVLFVLISSCALTTFQTPEVLPPGKAAVGGGVGLGLGPYAGSLEGDSIGPLTLPEIDIWARVGVSSKIDMGFKASKQEEFTSFFVDAKHQLSQNGFRSSLGLGVSWAGILEGGSGNGLYLVPTWLSGSRDFYCGLRAWAALNNEPTLIGFSIPLGVKLHIWHCMTMFEASLHLLDPEVRYPMISLGLGCEYNL